MKMKRMMKEKKLLTTVILLSIWIFIIKHHECDYFIIHKTTFKQAVKIYNVNLQGGKTEQLGQFTSSMYSFCEFFKIINECSSKLKQDYNVNDSF